MNIEEYKKSLKIPLRDRTLVFLIRNNEIILGLKKRGFGKGNILGIGGKIENKEKVEDAAKREVKEEIGVELNSLEYRGFVVFYFPHIADESWDQKVHIFTSSDWSGEVIETEEIKPMTFDIKEIPYEKMWDDNIYWLPKVLKGQSIGDQFMLDDKLKVINFVPL